MIIPSQTSKSHRLKIGNEYTGLTHLPLVPHICDGKAGQPIRSQAIFWTSAEILSIGPLGTIYSEINIKIQHFSFTKFHLKISSAKCRPFCPGEMS